MDKTGRISADFRDTIRDWLLREEDGETVFFKTVIENRKRRKADPSDGTCASHDRFDANVAMGEACRRAGVSVDADDQEVCGIWNAAWEKALLDEFGLAGYLEGNPAGRTRFMALAREAGVPEPVGTYA